MQLSSLYLLSTLDVIHVTFWTRLSPPFLSGRAKVVHKIICAEDGEPGNEAKLALYHLDFHCLNSHFSVCASLSSELCHTIRIPGYLATLVTTD